MCFWPAVSAFFPFREKPSRDTDCDLAEEARGIVYASMIIHTCRSAPKGRTVFLKGRMFTGDKKEEEECRTEKWGLDHKLSS